MILTLIIHKQYIHMHVNVDKVTFGTHQAFVKKIVHKLGVPIILVKQ